MTDEPTPETDDSGEFIADWDDDPELQEYVTAATIAATKPAPHRESRP